MVSSNCVRQKPLAVVPSPYSSRDISIEDKHSYMVQ
jgi:hypothetical protein